ncbi:telomeric repeat-binding factor 1 isoform X1 [Phyllopteryx taeniolatus]|uniref:telomeric repeat-binding factor 1 isoform X1 n=1 Tax=Phyllopteryx taeniolatus TaxID=161469 RepID=UPI002AD42DAB|nr:telomeric repeat-binding factor 1 isoform X1 [Phyllopteryx taeniolatus]
MEQQANGDSDETTTTATEEVYNTSQLTDVASKWILDFLFVDICRRFKEGIYDTFNDAISTYESVCQTPLLKGGSSNEKTLICAFLTRVMRGRQLDTRFDDDVMPLMSAAKSWFHLKDAVEDESLFDNITLHLIIQSVAVCLEKGQRTQASGALKWFEEHVEYPQKVCAKLSTIVAEMDTYHPFLTVFSFARLLETVRTFLDAYLAKCPSDFLLKEAIKVVRLSQSIDATDATAKEDKSLLEKVDHARLETEAKPNLQIIGNKKLRVSLQRQSVNELLSSHVSSAADERSVDASEDAVLSQKDDVRPERKLRATKRAHVSGRRLYSNKPSELDASPDTAGVRQAKTALRNGRLSADDKADQSGEITTKPKRRLLSPQTNVWEPDTQMKPQVCIRQLREKDGNDPVTSRQRTRRKWSSELDKRLTQGVRRHGKGKWYQILQDYDFEGRTGIMLKDRWRVLERTNKVDY